MSAYASAFSPSKRPPARQQEQPQSSSSSSSSGRQEQRCALPSSRPSPSLSRAPTAESVPLPALFSPLIGRHGIGSVCSPPPESLRPVLVGSSLMEGSDELLPVAPNNGSAAPHPDQEDAIPYEDPPEDEREDDANGAAGPPPPRGEADSSSTAAAFFKTGRRITRVATDGLFASARTGDHPNFPDDESYPSDEERQDREQQLAVEHLGSFYDAEDARMTDEDPSDSQTRGLESAESEKDPSADDGTGGEDDTRTSSPRGITGTLFDSPQGDDRAAFYEAVHSKKSNKSTTADAAADTNRSRRPRLDDIQNRDPLVHPNHSIALNVPTVATSVAAGTRRDAEENKKKESKQKWDDLKASGQDALTLTPEMQPSMSSQRREALRRRFEQHLPKYGELWRAMVKSKELRPPQVLDDVESPTVQVPGSYSSTSQEEDEDDSSSSFEKSESSFDHDVASPVFRSGTSNGMSFGTANSFLGQSSGPKCTVEVATLVDHSSEEQLVVNSTEQRTIVGHPAPIVAIHDRDQSGPEAEEEQQAAVDNVVQAESFFLDRQEEAHCAAVTDRSVGLGGASASHDSSSTNEAETFFLDADEDPTAFLVFDNKSSSSDGMRSRRDQPGSESESFEASVVDSSCAQKKTESSLSTSPTGAAASVLPTVAGGRKSGGSTDNHTAPAVLMHTRDHPGSESARQEEAQCAAVTDRSVVVGLWGASSGHGSSSTNDDGVRNRVSSSDKKDSYQAPASGSKSLLHQQPQTRRRHERRVSEQRAQEPVRQQQEVQHDGHASSSNDQKGPTGNRAERRQGKRAAVHQSSSDVMPAGFVASTSQQLQQPKGRNRQIQPIVAEQPTRKSARLKEARQPDRLVAEADRDGKTMTYQDKQWYERYLKLVKYKREHGHCRVLKSENEPLSIWVRTQKEMRRKHDLGRIIQTERAETRIQLLNDLGFEWSLLRQKKGKEERD